MINLLKFIYFMFFLKIFAPLLIPSENYRNSQKIIINSQKCLLTQMKNYLEILEYLK